MRTVLSVLALAASCEAFTPLAATRHAVITRRSKMSPVVRFNAPETEPEDGTVRKKLALNDLFRWGGAQGRAGMGCGASARADGEAGAAPVFAVSMRVTGPRRGRTSRPQRSLARSSRDGPPTGAGREVAEAASRHERRRRTWPLPERPSSRARTCIGSSTHTHCHRQPPPLHPHSRHHG